MKIDVITLHRVRNYGSSLQTLATQSYLEQNGVETEVIDYYQERYTSIGLLKRLKNKSKRLKNNKILLLAAQAAISVSYLKKKIIFDGFLKKYIKLTTKIYRTEEELKKDYPVADAYCTGSDQVWNSHWNEGIDKPLYLSFLPDASYRFSYASSLGEAEISNEEKKMISPYLAKYSYITVRENTGINNIEHTRQVEQMPDPTLLFEADWWNKYTSNRYQNKNYVLTYNLHHDARIDEYANCLAKKHGLIVLNISYNWHDIIRKGRLVWCPTVEEYLGLIRDAKYVVTDSFHATVFSLIFGTKFIDIFPEKASSRLRSLLTLVNAENRGFDEMPSLQAADVEINFDDVHEKIREEQNRARKYIETVLDEIRTHNCIRENQGNYE